jgi:hypothetical protein
MALLKVEQSAVVTASQKAQPTASLKVDHLVD